MDLIPAFLPHHVRERYADGVESTGPVMETVDFAVVGILDIRYALFSWRAWPVDLTRSPLAATPS